MDRWLTFVNGCFAFAAVWGMVWAATLVGGWLKTGLRFAAGLAMIYFWAYVWLYFNPDRRLDWSQTMRWFSLLAWPAVWLWLPISIVHYLKSHARTIESEAERVVSEDE